MKNPTQLSSIASMHTFHKALTQSVNNFSEIAKHSHSNPKVREMCQSLCEALNSIDDWSDLPGSVMVIVAYQPGMFDDDEFGRVDEYDPR